MHKHFSKAFTIVEVMVVVAVVAILATLVTVGYGAVSKNAAETSMKADLNTAIAEIGAYMVENNKLPSSIDDLNNGQGLSVSDKNEISYIKSGPDYCLSVTSQSLPDKKYSVTREVENPVEGDCPDLMVGNGSYMQTINSSNCPDQRTRAVDARDNHTYWVQKLADGKCWMLTNLAYAGGTSNGGTSHYEDTKAITKGSSGSTTTSPMYYAVPTGIHYTIEPTPPSTSTSWDGQTGYLYNWCAAMGSQIGTSACSSTPITTPALDTNISACPAGWRLPTGYTTGELGVLNNTINSGSTTSDAGLRETWLIQRAGIWNSGFTDYGSQGYYWSSSRYSAPTVAVWRMQVSGSQVNLTTASPTSYGMSVRCLAI